jgi:hypothetical protein
LAEASVKLRHYPDSVWLDVSLATGSLKCLCSPLTGTVVSPAPRNRIEGRLSVAARRTAPKGSDPCREGSGGPAPYAGRLPGTRHSLPTPARGSDSPSPSKLLDALANLGRLLFQPGCFEPPSGRRSGQVNSDVLRSGSISLGECLPRGAVRFNAIFSTLRRPAPVLPRFFIGCVASLRLGLSVVCHAR